MFVCVECLCQHVVICKIKVDAISLISNCGSGQISNQ